MIAVTYFCFRVDGRNCECGGGGGGGQQSCCASSRGFGSCDCKCNMNCGVCGGNCAGGGCGDCGNC